MAPHPPFVRAPCPPDNDQNAALCANELPNFVNFDHCRLSHEEDVCVKEDAYDIGVRHFVGGNLLNDVQLVVTFDRDTLPRLRNATLASADGEDRSRYILAVDGLGWDGSAIGADGSPGLELVRVQLPPSFIPLFHHLTGNFGSR